MVTWPCLTCSMIYPYAWLKTEPLTIAACTKDLMMDPATFVRWPSNHGVSFIIHHPCHCCVAQVFSRNKVRKNFLLTCISPQTWVLWPPSWRGNGMSKNAPPIVPSPIRNLCHFQNCRPLLQQIKIFETTFNLPRRQCGTLIHVLCTLRCCLTFHLVTFAAPSHTLYLSYVYLRP